MTAKPLLRPDDAQAIQAALAAADARTSGEIYCVVAEESSHYPEVALAWAALVAILAPAILLMAGIRVTVPDLFGDWSAAEVSAAAEAAARSALLGAIVLQGLLFVVVGLVLAWPPARRAVTPGLIKRDHVRRRAAEQFLAKNLHAHHARTGVMIYVSLAERMAEIIAEDKVAAAVDPHAWDPAMHALVEGLKHGHAAQGFAAAIEACAGVMAQRFPAGPDDPPADLDALVQLPRA
jgi:putative membrane protein